MPKPMSLAQYRANIRIVGEKSALFEFKKEIFEAVDMGLSHEQIHYFLTTQKGLKISVRAVSKWIKNHKNTKPQIPSIPFSQKSEQKEANISTVVQSPKVESTEAPNHLSNNDDFYSHLRKVADKRAKWLGINPYITQETPNEDFSM